MKSFPDFHCEDGAFEFYRVQQVEPLVQTVQVVEEALYVAHPAAASGY